MSIFQPNLLATAKSQTVHNQSETMAEKRDCDVLIIGAGLAGLTTALSLPKSLNIIVLAKENLQGCSSHYAQGGIAAVIDENDKVADHVNDTLIAGDGLCDKENTTHILSQGKQAIDWLLKKEVPFTTHHTDDKLSNKSELGSESESRSASKFEKLKLSDLHLTKEGGHGCRRVAHAEDATGRHIMTSLHQVLGQSSNISVLPYHEALTLITDTAENHTSNLSKSNLTNSSNQIDANRFVNDLDKKLKLETKCVGAQVFDTQNNRIINIKSRAVVLASGGLGQLFSRATAPNVCVGDGIMMAWEAGCRLANLEFIQFHPTGLVDQHENGDRNFLISEAVRGEGGLLYNPATGKRFMPEYDSRAELAPRDIVARAIANEIANNGLGYVHLDISHQPKHFIREHFPDIYAHCLSLGIDMTTDPIPVAPTAHYTCGGVLTTASGQTDVRGLYAAGEVANTGLHGANRLASNSLLECVVVGREVASHIPQYLSDSCNWQSPKVSNVLADGQAISGRQILTYSNVSTTMINSQIVKSDLMSDNKSDIKHDIKHKLSLLKQMMTTHMGIRRSKASLKQALNQVSIWQNQYSSQSLSSENNHLCGNTDQLNVNKGHLGAKKSQSQKLAELTINPYLKSQLVINNELDIERFRFSRLLTLASLLLQSAISREESRGGHFRNDFPNTGIHPAISLVEPIKSQVQTHKNISNLMVDAIWQSTKQAQKIAIPSL